MKQLRHSRLYPAVMIFFLAAASISILLSCSTTETKNTEPLRTADVQPGDCSACHAAKQVLPQGHADTKGTLLGTCTACHKDDEAPITCKMPSSHAHMLSGVSCRACHGDTQPFTAVEMGTCVSCHDIDALVKSTDKGENGVNPHTSHYGPELDCNLCHHQHAASEFFCAQCHDFPNVTPSPMIKLSGR